MNKARWPILSQDLEPDKFSCKVAGLSNFHAGDRSSVAKLAAVAQNRNCLSQAQQRRIQLSQACRKLQGHTVDSAAVYHIFNYPRSVWLIGVLQGPQQLENVKWVAAGHVMDGGADVIVGGASQGSSCYSSDAALTQQRRTNHRRRCCAHCNKRLCL
jgi:hypothetical protein